MMTKCYLMLQYYTVRAMLFNEPEHIFRLKAT